MKKLSFLAVLAILVSSCCKDTQHPRPVNQNYFYYAQSVDQNDSINRSPIVVVYSADTQYVNMSIETNALDASTELGSSNESGCDCKATPNDPRCKAMPVTFTGITVEKLPGYNKLTWDVATEEHLLYYSVMRSADGKNYVEIARVKPQGLSQYTYIDSFR